MSKVNHKMGEVEEKIRQREAEIELLKSRQNYNQLDPAKVTAPYA